MAETKVTERDVMYVADLANLELTAEEKGRMIRDLNSILEHIDTLNELDTSDVPPLAEVASMFAGSQAADGGRFGYAMRPDEVRPGPCRYFIVSAARSCILNFPGVVSNSL